MDELRIVCPVHAPGSGYSKLARAALRTALLAGYKVQAVESDYRVRRTYYKGGRILEKRQYEKWSKKHPPAPFQEEECNQALRTKVSPNAPTLLIQFPEQVSGWQEFSQGPRLAWTMLESDRVPDRWVKHLFGADLLLAPSRYVYNTFRRDVPEIECELLPLPVDERLFAGTEVAIGGRFPEFLFFSVFNTRERKHWRMMMQAFAEEFDVSESVGLVVKPSLHVGDVCELANWLNEPNSKRHIIVLREWQSDEQLSAWYKRCHAYVLPGAEGFGLPFVEAALCGLPSVALDDGGAWDVVTVETGWRVKSERKQVIGNLPHVYDSTHRFPCPESIEELRRVMRLCHTAITNGDNKGPVAQRKALEQFTPQASAEPLRMAVDKASDVFKSRTRLWGSIAYHPEWGLMIGDGFGDALACIGNIQSLSKEPVGVIHYGKSKAVDEFLSQQPIVREVRQITPESNEARIKLIDDIGIYAYPAGRWLPKLLEGTGIRSTMVAETQVHWNWGTWPVHRPSEVVLSAAAVSWAEEQHKELGEFILVQPFSTSSVDENAHWPFWIPFLVWLLQSTESTHRLVFCGLKKIPGLKGPNVVDLMEETPSMQHVLALSDRAKGIITTCNGLANYAACKGLRALIAGNYALPGAWGFWSRFMSVKSTKLMLVDTSLEKFKKAAEVFLGRLSK